MLQFSKAQTGEKKQYPKIDKAGKYIAEVVKVEQIQNKEHADWTPGIRFLFRVLEEPFASAFTSGIVSSKWKLGNALDTWCAAMGINGEELTENTADDIFKKRRVVVGVEITSKDDKSYANVKALYPPRPEDIARISVDTTKFNAAPQVAPTQTVAKSTAPVVNNPVNTTLPGTITQDDSLPF